MATKGDFYRLDLVPAILLSHARERGRWRKNSVYLMSDLQRSAGNLGRKNGCTRDSGPESKRIEQKATTANGRELTRR